MALWQGRLLPWPRALWRTPATRLQGGTTPSSTTRRRRTTPLQVGMLLCRVVRVGCWGCSAVLWGSTSDADVKRCKEAGVLELSLWCVLSCACVVLCAGVMTATLPQRPTQRLTHTGLPHQQQLPTQHPQRLQRHPAMQQPTPQAQRPQQQLLLVVSSR